MRKSFFIILACVVYLTSCSSSKTLYSWYDSEDATYQYTKRSTEESLTQAMKQYEKVINKQKGVRGVIPPGVCAEYGFLLSKNGKTEEGLKFLKEEIRLYPESEIFMQLMQNAFREQSLSFAESVSSSMSNGPFRKTWGVMQGNFCVLRRASMPAVLLEFGFMTNPDDLSTLRVEKNIDRIVENLFNAFSSYKEVYDASVSITPGVESEKAETSESAPKQEGTAFYGIQVLASSRELSPNDRFFKGQDVICVKSGKMYKYIICTSSDLSAVRKSYSSLKPNFPESFIVKVDGETISVQN